MSMLTRGVESTPPGNDDRVPDAAHVVGRPHPVRWAAAFVVLVLLAQFVHLLVTNERFRWDVVLEFVATPRILQALLVTLELSVIGMLIGVVLGVVVAVSRMSSNWLLQGTANGFIWFFRGVPLLVQLIFWYNLGALLPQLSIGIPFGPHFASWETNDVVTPLIAAVLGLGLNEAAYMAEIFRGGLLSVDPGQREAAAALGMREGRILFRILLPQAMRFIVPPTGNQVISMVKATSLVSVIAMEDLLFTVQRIYNFNFQVIPLLLVACIWYLIVTTVLYIGQSFIERYYARGATRTPAMTYRERRLLHRSRQEAAAKDRGDA